MEGASSSAHALPPRVSDESSGEKTDGDQANKGRGSKKGVMKKPASRAVKGHDDDTTDHEHQPLGGKKTMMMMITLMTRLEVIQVSSRI